MVEYAQKLTINNKKISVFLFTSKNIVATE